MSTWSPVSPAGRSTPGCGSSNRSGRADGQGGLSARTVRYVYTILRSALSDAVRQGRLEANPTDRSTPPRASEARPPEMQAWTAPELARFLSRADAQDPDLAMG